MGNHRYARASRPPRRHDRGAVRARCGTRRTRSRRCRSPPAPDPLADEDLQLALYCCYELHYRGLHGVDERWEWEPSLLALRAALEARFEAALRDAVGPVGGRSRSRARWTSPCARSDADDGPSLSRYVEREATLEQVREFLIHRSAYQLKEADPHSWALPRLSGAPKAALVEIQADEYGGGRAGAHPRAAVRRRDGRRGPRRDATAPTSTGSPRTTLATVNLMSLFGLHRRLRGAIVGHLALFEMTSSIPNRRYATGLRRLGLDDGDRRSSTSTSRPTPSTRRSRPSTSPAASRARSRSWPATSSGAPARSPRSRRRWAELLLGAWARGESSLLPAAVAPVT